MRSMVLSTPVPATQSSLLRRGGQKPGRGTDATEPESHVRWCAHRREKSGWQVPPGKRRPLPGETNELEMVAKAGRPSTNGQHVGLVGAFSFESFVVFITTTGGEARLYMVRLHSFFLFFMQKERGKHQWEGAATAREARRASSRAWD